MRSQYLNLPRGSSTDYCAACIRTFGANLAAVPRCAARPKTKPTPILTQRNEPQVTRSRINIPQRYSYGDRVGGACASMRRTTGMWSVHPPTSTARITPQMKNSGREDQRCTRRQTTGQATVDPRSMTPSVWFVQFGCRRNSPPALPTC